MNCLQMNQKSTNSSTVSGNSQHFINEFENASKIKSDNVCDDLNQGIFLLDNTIENIDPSESNRVNTFEEGEDVELHPLDFDENNLLRPRGSSIEKQEVNK